MSALEVYMLAIGANLTFSTSSMVFSLFSRRFSALWVSQIKVMVAFTSFLIALIFTAGYVKLNLTTAGFLLSSGLIGLCFGDIFLFKAYATLGAGRSLVLFSFQPLLVGIYGYFFLNQFFTLNQTLAVICMIICIFIFMLERNRMTGTWDVKSFMWAFIGILLDSIGIMLTRSAYEATPELDTFMVNVVRCSGALIGFFVINPKSYWTVTKDVLALKKTDMGLILSAAIFGCFVSLTLYLAALKYAHVGTLTAISITGPIWVSLLECLYYKKLPNFFLIAALSFFLMGFYLMLIA